MTKQLTMYNKRQQLKINITITPEDLHGGDLPYTDELINYRKNLKPVDEMTDEEVFEVFKTHSKLLNEEVNIYNKYYEDKNSQAIKEVREEMRNLAKTLNRINKTKSIYGKNIKSRYDDVYGKNFKN